MQGDPKLQPEAKKKEEDDDRGIFFWFPFFRGKRMEAIPPFLLLGLFLLLALWFWPRPQSTDPATTAAAPTQPVAVETQRWGSSVIFPIEGKDAAGRRATFDVAVLPKDLAWVVKSSTQLALAGQEIPNDQLAGRLFTPELRDGLSKSAQLIAIGLASQEGQVQEETARAADRARNAATWLSSAFPQETGIWMLNLGQFKKTGCTAQTETTDTSWQRPVILVGVKTQDDGTDLSQAFADAINGKSNLPSRDCYTAFDLSKFR